MKNSKGIALLAAGLVVLLLLGFLADQACHVLPNKLKQSELKYEAYRAMSVEKDKISDAKIADLQAQLVESEKVEAVLNQTIETQKVQIQAQAQTIADLQAAEPPTTPEIEAMPIVINLRAQIKALVQGFSLAQQTIAEQEKLIVQLKMDKEILTGQVNEWIAKYNREHTLRLAAEGLYADSKKVLGLFRLSGTAKDILIGGLVAGTVYGLVRK